MKMKTILKILAPISVFILASCNQSGLNSVSQVQDSIDYFADEEMIVAFEDQTLLLFHSDYQPITNLSADQVWVENMIYYREGGSIYALRINGDDVINIEIADGLQVLFNNDGDIFLAENYVTTAVSRVWEQFLISQKSSTVTISPFGYETNRAQIDTISNAYHMAVHSESPYLFYADSSNGIYSYQLFTKEIELIDHVPDTVLRLKHYTLSNELLVIAESMVFVYNLVSDQILMGQEDVFDAALDPLSGRMFLLKENEIEVVDMNEMKTLTNLQIGKI